MKSEQKKETQFDGPGDDQFAGVGGAVGVSGDGGGESDEDASERLGLPEQLEAALKKAEDSQDLFLRERAELDNFRKRTMRDRAEASRFAVEPLARDLLTVVDNLGRATEHARASGGVPSVVEGLDLVLQAATEALERHGVTRVEAVGQVFDPSIHEALVQVASDEVPANHVVEQFAPGYRLHDRLLRAAQVSVSTGAASGEDE